MRTAGPLIVCGPVSIGPAKRASLQQPLLGSWQISVYAQSPMRVSRLTGSRNVLCPVFNS